MEEESASKRQKSSLSLSLSSEWDMSDLSSFRSWVVSGAKKKEEKLSSGSAPLAESPVASPAVSNSSSSLCNIVADESDEEAEKVLLDDSSGWHWLSFGRPPLKTVNPQNEALVASLKALASFYKLFPDSVQLGPQKQRNDLRALKCRAIYNFVRGAEIRICKADQLAHVKGIKKSWREKIDCLIDHGELDVQKQVRLVDASSFFTPFLSKNFLSASQRGCCAQVVSARSLDRPSNVLGLVFERIFHAGRRSKPRALESDSKARASICRRHQLADSKKRSRMLRANCQI